MGAKKVLKKTGFGILFVAACFMATYILMAFHNKILRLPNSDLHFREGKRYIRWYVNQKIPLIRIYKFLPLL